MNQDRSPAMICLPANVRPAGGSTRIQANQPLARYTALRIGGAADLLVVAESVEALREAVVFARDRGIPYRVLGGGSNVLVSDAGVRGLVVLNRARALSFSPTGVRAESGASFSTVARRCIAQGLAGLEWASSIPGTVGGAVVGNAGAWGGDVASTLVQATILDHCGAVRTWPAKCFAYGYRTSILKQPAAPTRRQVIVLEAEFALQPGDPEALQTRVNQISNQRKASQPPGATCGSVFKNPRNDYAGRLIEAAGLKGMRKGKAQISPVHANFIVNHSDATAADVKALIDLARHAVKAQFGVSLELEIELIGEW